MESKLKNDECHLVDGTNCTTSDMTSAELDAFKSDRTTKANNLYRQGTRATYIGKEDDLDVYIVRDSYDIKFNGDSFDSCTCHDYLYRGSKIDSHFDGDYGACKHMRYVALLKSMGKV